MKQRTITAIILILIVLPLFYFGGWWTVFFATAFVFCGIYELLRARKEMNWPISVYIVAFLGGAVMLFWPFIINTVNVMNQTGQFIFDFPERFLVQLNVVFVCFFLLALLFIEAVSKRFSVNDVFYVFTMTFLICIAGQAFIFLRQLGSVHESENILQINDGLMIVLYVVFCTYCTDTCALFCGKFFGRHKMAPITSPKKTWEGAIGGILCTTLLGIVFYQIFPFGKHYTPLLIMVLSFVLAIGAVVGDLIFSSIKRNYQIKDFGNIFPGHGGMLDRVDSLVFNLMIFICLYAVITGGMFI